MERELGTDRRDVPHQFVESDDDARSDCEVCDKSAGDVRHEEWARVNAASRQTAAHQVPRVFG